MGYVPILSILDHTPAGISDRVGIGDDIPGWGHTGIRCIRVALGVRYSATGFTLDVLAPSGATTWSGVSAFISDSITGQQVEAFNKLLRGTGFPRVETNWRTKALTLNLPGNRVPLPVLASATLVDNVLSGDVRIETSASVVPPAPAIRPAPKPSAPSTVVTSEPFTPGEAAAILTAPAPVLSPTPSNPVRATLVAPRITAENLTEVFPAVRAPVSPVHPEPVHAPIKAERIAPVVDPTGVFAWPTKGSGIVVKAGDEEDLDRVWAMHLGGDRQVVALRGPSGTGKTSLAYDLAARHKVPIAKIDGAGAVTFADWVGFQSATERNGATVTEWQPSGFIQAVRADGPMAGVPRIVLLDEVNRAESSSATNALIPCLDHTGSLYIADAGRSIPLDSSVLYVMTANMGGAYTGTIALDAALTNRVTHWVTMGYPTEVVEVGIVTERTGLDEGRARLLVKAAQQVRAIAERGEISEGVGPRLVLVAARKIRAGFNPRSACLSTWALAYNDEGGTTSEQSIVRSAIEGVLR